MLNADAYANYQQFCTRLQLPPANPLFWEALSEPRIRMRGGAIPIARCSAGNLKPTKRKHKRYKRRPPLFDLVGQRFRRLVVIKHLPRLRGCVWLCKCDCGRNRKAKTGELRQGQANTCGNGCSLIGKWAHIGGSRTPEYMAYADARYRCTSEKSTNWPNYGGRGIKFLFKDYGEFFACVGKRPKGRSLDRIDVNGNYEPGNVRWATGSEQWANRRCVLLQDKNEFGEPVY
jgi:hypothetical protein